LTIVAISDERSRRNCEIGNRSKAVDQLIAQAAQHPLADTALEGVDVEFERAVDQHERQEGEAEINEHRYAAELDPFEQNHRTAAEQPSGRIEGDPEGGFGVRGAWRIPRPGSVR
jgi:hypothetical protein